MVCLTRTQRIERWLEAAKTGKVRPEDAKAAVKYLREKLIKEAQERREAAGPSVVKRIVAALALAAILLLPGLTSTAGPVPREVYGGQVIEVHDGDTPRVILKSPLGDAARWLRLDGADCPETDQPWGTKALARTLRLVWGKKIIIELTGAVTHSRPVALIWLPDGSDLAAVLVKEGLAWVDPRYAKGARGKALKALMAEAQADRRGLGQTITLSRPGSGGKRGQAKNDRPEKHITLMKGNDAQPFPRCNLRPRVVTAFRLYRVALRQDSPQVGKVSRSHLQVAIGKGLPSGRTRLLHGAVHGPQGPRHFGGVRPGVLGFGGAVPAPFVRPGGVFGSTPAQRA
jgi:endonuclease YncB( thermonuclease family)